MEAAAGARSALILIRPFHNLGSRTEACHILLRVSLEGRRTLHTHFGSLGAFTSADANPSNLQHVLN